MILNPIESKKVFGSFISEKVTFYPSEFPKQRQLAAIAVLINEQGEVTQLEWANPLGCEKKFADRYLKAVKSWKEGYTPALDENGVPVGKWRLFHFNFGSTTVAN